MLPLFFVRHLTVISPLRLPFAIFNKINADLNTVMWKN